MAVETDPSTYKVPEKFATMTTSANLSGETYESVEEYFSKNHYALLADLIGTRLPNESIENAVHTGIIKAAPWPLEERITDLLWSKEQESTTKLDQLAARAIEACYGKTAQEPIAGNIMSVGAEMDSQQLALVGLVYARARGDLREITPPEDSDADLMQTMYVVRDSVSGRMFDKLMPEEPAQ